MLQCEYEPRHECHSYHFAPFMDDCDPMVLREVWPSSYQYHTDVDHPDELANIEKIDGFEIVSVWDVQGRARGEKFSQFVKRRPVVCDTIEQAIDGVDAVFLADGGGDGSKHLQWVTPILSQGIPVFVDKPLADTYARGKAIVDMANEHGTPLLSASILQYVDEINHFRTSWSRIGQPGLAVIRGVGPSEGAVVHGLALMHGLFGLGVEWVEAMGELSREVMMMQYPQSPQVVLLNTSYNTFDWFSCEVWAQGNRTNPPRKMYMRSETIGDPEFLPASHRIVTLFKQMLDTGKPPVSYDAPLEQAALLDAGKRAHETRQRVYLKDIMTDRA